QMASATQLPTLLYFDLEKGESALGISIVGMETEACYSGQVDGRLHEGDQILAVNGKPFESSVTHEQAVQVLLEAASVVTLIIAREPAPSFSPPQVSHTLPKNLCFLCEVLGLVDFLVMVAIQLSHLLLARLL
uniref:PDZ domain-containing protein n=1 Tax=Sinocyclocheilus grahami TaxID=75366 RepID=A0A672KAJ6_SINGR